MSDPCQHLSLTGLAGRGHHYYHDLVLWLEGQRPDRFSPEPISNEIIGAWGRMRLTDWLMHYAQLDDPQGWPSSLPPLVNADVEGWQSLIDPTDVFAVVLGKLVANRDSGLEQSLAKALAKLYTGSVAEATGHLYWPGDRPTAGEARPEHFTRAAEKFRGLRQSAPEQVIYGALAPGNNNEEAHCGVLRIGLSLRKSQQDDWDLRVLPWSRYVPQEGTLQSQGETVARAAREHLKEYLPQEVFLNLQPTATEDHRAVFPIRSFEGESLGLAIVLALFAHMQGREIRAWATGKLGENGVIGNVGYVQSKAKALGHFLLTPAADTDPEDLYIFVPAVADGRLKARAGLSDAGAERYQGQIVPVERIGDILKPERLFDPFYQDVADLPQFFKQYDVVLEAPRARQDAHSDAAFWSCLTPTSTNTTTSAETLCEKIATRWATLDGNTPDPEAGEILLCTPFHADPNDAKHLVERSAAKLAAYLCFRRAHQHLISTKFPVPLLLDLASWNPDGTDTSLGQYLYKKLPVGHRNALGKGNKPLKGESVERALSQPNRLALIIFDTDVKDCRLFDKSERSLQRFRRTLRMLVGKVPASGVKRQNLVVLAPDIHVQLFWAELLRDEGCQLQDGPCELAVEA